MPTPGVVIASIRALKDADGLVEREKVISLVETIDRVDGRLSNRVKAELEALVRTFEKKGSEAGYDKAFDESLTWGRAAAMLADTLELLQRVG